jgi:polyhydroxybutyrate depolymerase
VFPGPHLVTVLCATGCAVSLGACAPPAPELGTVDYTAVDPPRLCAPREKPGSAGGANRILTSHEIPFSVRTPANYDATRAHPLLVMFAPGGKHRYESERFYGMTRQATSAGFIVAYPDHLKLSLRAFEELGQVPELIAGGWCVDPQRVYFAGHSDGGTTSAAVTFLARSSLPPRAIVVSGAGIRRQDLEQHACPAPVSVMVIHSRADSLFPLPAFGRDAAGWWAACGRCGEPSAPPDAHGCVRFQACASGAEVRYCETTGPHAKWQVSNAALLAFLTARLPDR